MIGNTWQPKLIGVLESLRLATYTNTEYHQLESIRLYIYSIYDTMIAIKCFPGQVHEHRHLNTLPNPSASTFNILHLHGTTSLGRWVRTRLQWRLFFEAAAAVVPEPSRKRSGEVTTRAMEGRQHTGARLSMGPSD